MTLQMIDLSPSLRPTFDTLLSTARNSAFPESFYDFYHGYVHSIEELPSPSPFTYSSQPNATTSSTIPPRATNATGHTATGLPAEGASTPTSAHPSVSAFSANSHTTFASSNTMHPTPSNVTARTEARVADGSGHGNPLPRDADRRIDAIWADFEKVIPNLNQELRVEGAADQYSNENMVGTWMSRSTQAKISHVSLAIHPQTTAQHISRISFRWRLMFPTWHPLSLVYATRQPRLLLKVRSTTRTKAISDTHPVTDGTSLIILSLISSNIRSCILPSSKLKALDLMLFLSCYLTDEAKLDRLIPYVVDLLHDDAAVVRAAAVRAILQVVSSQSTHAE